RERRSRTAAADLLLTLSATIVRFESLATLVTPSSISTSHSLSGAVVKAYGRDPHRRKSAVVLDSNSLPNPIETALEKSETHGPTKSRASAHGCDESFTPTEIGPFGNKMRACPNLYRLVIDLETDKLSPVT